MASLIEDYALIGDLQTCALIARDGSIDWLCVPRFDSPAFFASLLGTPDNGRWKIAPDGEVLSVSRHYKGETLILVTEFESDGGRVRLTDFMPIRSCELDIVRVVEGIDGTVPMHMDLTIRFDYGSIVPWVRAIEHGIVATAGPDTVYCRSREVPMRGEGLKTVADFTIAAGERVAFNLTWRPTFGPPPSFGHSAESLQKTESFWLDWSGRCSYDGPWREAVVRSFITLKALTHAPTGGIVAAATTSLPEQLGGVRNWDYRFCWLRDATFSLYSLMIGGYVDEARAWREWLVHAAAGRPEELQPMYGLAGERRLTELELPWLEGYEKSVPVRIGNAAFRQYQLDVYGELIDVLHVARKAGLPPDENAWRVECAVLKFLERGWREPDEGIWEVRGPRRHFTHSKVMAWVAFDRAVAAVEHFGLKGPLERWRAIRDQIHADVLANGFNADLNGFVQFYGSGDADASLLLLPSLGFLPIDDPRVSGTVELVRKQLEVDGLINRYPSHREIDGLPPGEGTFLLCTFWLADVLALQGKIDEATAIFERLLALQNDVGLLSEQFDVPTRRHLGNFPQAFSHVGLINTARNLQQHGGPAEDRKKG